MVKLDKIMHFTLGQILLLLAGIGILIFGVTGIGISGVFTGIGFLMICVALCYRKWWSNRLDETV